MDLSAATCLLEAESLEAARDYIESMLVDCGENSYFEINQEHARGLPGRHRSESACKQPRQREAVMSTEAEAANQLDPVTLNPEHYKVEVENERIRAIRISYAPGDKSEMHSHPASVAVLLTDADVRYTYPDGSTEVIHGNAGDVMWLPPTTHQPENVGDNRFELIEIEMKD
jgi:quercetin dioxygenase-like cupin family protein